MNLHSIRALDLGVWDIAEFGGLEGSLDFVSWEPESLQFAQKLGKLLRQQKPQWKKTGSAKPSTSPGSWLISPWHGTTGLGPPLGEIPHSTQEGLLQSSCGRRASQKRCHL